MARESPGSVRRLDLVIAGTAAALAVSLVVVLAQPHPLIENRDLDNAFAGLVAGIATMAALLQWLRYRETRSGGAFLLAAALIVLAVGNVTRIVVASSDIEHALGFALERPGQAPAYGWLVTRAIAAAFFVLAAVAELRGWSTLPRSVATAGLIGPLAAIVATPIAHALEPVLPQLVTPGTAATGPAATLVFGTSNVAIAALFSLAAAFHREVYRVSGARRAAYLALALLVAAFGQLHAAIDVTIYVGILAFGDGLRATFYVLQMLAFQADARDSLRALRQSRDELIAARASEIEAAVIGERARLAREIHDGLTQELWLTKLRLGELEESMGAAAMEQRPRLDQVRSALDSAAREARHAIVALDVASRPAADFVGSLAEYVDLAGDRLGVTVSFEVRGPVRDLPPATGSEIVRIVQEALSNVRKHAHASMATVVVEERDGRVAVIVEDDGVGIPESLPDRGHGVASMHQRAELIGAELRLARRAHRGTRVELILLAPEPAE